MATEKNQEFNADSNISLDNIYKAVGYLKPEHQGIILNNYKLTELYSILADDESYKKYINDLFAVSNEYSNRAIALSALHTEAFLQSLGRRKVNMLDTMNHAYNNLSEENKKAFCKEMLNNKDFFEDAYKIMTEIFESAMKTQSDNVVNRIVEK